jgi:hypothetical protein
LDVNVLAYRVVQRAVEEAPLIERDKRAASRKGGIRGGTARALTLPPERRQEIAKKANAARWAKKKRQ